MRILDYCRLGLAGVKAHKKRAALIIIIVSLLFSLLTAVTFVLQGLENATFSAMLASTDGEILIMSAVDSRVCNEDCDTKAEVAKIKSLLKKYGGELIPAELHQTSDGIFYLLSENSLAPQNINLADDISQVIVPLDTAAALAGLDLPERDTPVAEKLQFVVDVRTNILHHTVSNPPETDLNTSTQPPAEYYIAEILPDGSLAGNLSFANIGQPNHPLNLIFAQIATGTSQNLLTAPAIQPEIDPENRPSGFVAREPIDTEESGMVFAEFRDLASALDYYHDKSNYCSAADRVFGTCGSDYRYQVASVISDPLTTSENLQKLWSIFRIVALALSIIAVIITISTYSRLVAKDSKIISLYYATGATRRQIRLIYATYLLFLSFIAVIFTMLLGLGLAYVLNLVNASALEQVFALGFGIPQTEILLIGWNNLIWCFIFAILLSAPLAVILSNDSLKAKKLARKMK